jgi:hypothetical protein
MVSGLYVKKHEKYFLFRVLCQKFYERNVCFSTIFLTVYNYLHSTASYMNTVADKYCGRKNLSCRSELRKWIILASLVKRTNLVHSFS